MVKNYSVYAYYGAFRFKKLNVVSNLRDIVV